VKKEDPQLTLLPAGKAAQPRAPRGLASAGRRFWRQMNETYEFDTEHLVILEQACRELDLIERLQEQIDNDPTLIARGSQGQPVSAPAVTAIKEHRTLLNMLIKSLSLPSEDANDGKMTRSEAGRKAAMVRWGKC
jgi:hypothetical protein